MTISIRPFLSMLMSTSLALFMAMIPISLSDAASSGENKSKNPRLVNAPSPYLRLHSTDDVQWYQWNDETFDLARKLNKPLMVSFGYTACHWCHVMQETHFTQKDIAATINENFIAVIVDRERRPALDEAYMLVTEVLTNRGGWPNTVFMTADRKPFYGTGYVPADHFRGMLASIVDGWKQQNGDYLAEAERLSIALGNYLTRQEASQELTSEFMSKTAIELAGQFDEFEGGFGGAPKFFQQPLLMFLMQQGVRDNNSEVLAAVELTLNSVISGGIHDHIEGGVHRYAVDPGWRIPHFEKMLYDQALMTEAFAEAYRITGKSGYYLMARKIANYVLADLTAAHGGFYATRDADSEGEEGTYYVWSVEQLTEILGKQDAAYATEVFETVPGGELAGKIILNRDQLDGKIDPRIENIMDRLATARQSRPKPQRDEKIVTGWNGMMIAALAHLASISNEGGYQEAAIKAGEFLWDKLRDDEGVLMRSYFEGKAQIKAGLGDHALFGRALIRLFDLTGEQRWLDRAQMIFDQMETRFSDTEVGDYFSSASNNGFGRTKSRGDTEMASSNGAALDFIVGLEKRVGGLAYKQRSLKLIAALSGFVVKNPAGGTSVLAAVDRFERGETGAVQYGGGGAVRVHATLDATSGTITARFKVRDGWHINAEKPLEDYLIPTKLSLLASDQQITVKYPEPLVKELGFSEEPLALIEGDIDITASIKSNTPGPTDIKLEFQACSDQICLAPDVLTFKLAPPMPKG